MSLHVAQIGNHEPRHSTETHLARAWEHNGHRVTRIQEQAGAWDQLLAVVASDRPDLVMWTRTGSHDQDPHDRKMVAINLCEQLGVPVVAYHLDRWWGLSREDQVRTEAFFRCTVVITADGGHQDHFEEAGVNHHWLPPGVSLAECEPGTPSGRWRSEVCFVGNPGHRRGGYHSEWGHRDELVSWLQRTYRRRFRLFPDPGRPAIRNEQLRDLYASSTVCVGDSCLVPRPDGPATRYWSDRIPETIGRGGFLLHPYVEGLDEHFDLDHHLVVWPMGEWDHLRYLIDHYLANPDERQRIADAGRAHVLAHHTYERRMEQVLDILCEEGWLCATQAEAA